MRPSVMAMANTQNPQPLEKKSVDSVITPAVIGSARHHTVVMQPGDVRMAYLFAPGHRKLVSNKSEGLVRVIGDNADNFDLGRESWVLFENNGGGWTRLYYGDGAKFVKKHRTESDDARQ